ncbi:acetolactate synthase large subunit, partial [bacterium]|nr:acetolactate synthase large subunit [bacterium]
NVQELETAARLRLPIVALVLRDDTYGLIKLKQRQHFERDGFVDFTNPDLPALAKSFGCEAIQINAADELPNALRLAFRSKKPVVIDCPVDYQENHRLMERLGKLVCPT